MIADFSSPGFRTFFQSIITTYEDSLKENAQLRRNNYVRNEVLSAKLPKHNTVYCKDMYGKVRSGSGLFGKTIFNPYCDPGSQTFGVDLEKEKEIERRTQ
jgi:hypothetical protein